MTLTYEYNPSGFMSRLDSSDGKIHHLFEYNLLGHLLFALDENENISLTREVDPFGNVLQEKFSSGLEIEKRYESF